MSQDSLTDGLRERVRKYDERPERDRVADTVRYGYDIGEVGALTTLVNCPWCVGVYAAAGVSLARAVAPVSWRAVARALALSAVAGELGARL